MAEKYESILYIENEVIGLKRYGFDNLKLAKPLLNINYGNVIDIGSLYWLNFYLRHIDRPF